MFAKFAGSWIDHIPEIYVEGRSETLSLGQVALSCSETAGVPRPGPLGAGELAEAVPGAPDTAQALQSHLPRAPWLGG